MKCEIILRKTLLSRCAFHFLKNSALSFNSLKFDFRKFIRSAAQEEANKAKKEKSQGGGEGGDGGAQA